MALEAVKDSSALGNLTERSGSHGKGRSAETALAATAEEDIYSREGEFILLFRQLSLS